MLSYVILPHALHIHTRNLISCVKVYHLRKLRTNICDSTVRRKHIHTKLDTLYYSTSLT